MQRRRILSGGIFQESHSFNPIITARTSFEVSTGSRAVALGRGTNSILGGIVDAAEAAGAQIVVPAYFRAAPAGPVDQAVYLELREQLLEEAAKGGIDAIVLALHGAMVTTELEDPEADLMQALRRVVGPGVPITAGLDLHAHVTPATLAPCDFLTGYKTNPHSDMAATGRRAFEAAHAMLHKEFDPVCASVHFPMLTLGRDRTDEEPLLGLHHCAAALVREGGLYDISIFNVQQFLDVSHLGQTVVAYAHGEPDRARRAADDIAQQLWDARDLTIGSYPSLESCLARAGEAGRTRPVVIGDQGDRVAAGGPGDSTWILSVIFDRFPHLSAAVPIRDEAAVAACLRAAPGDEVTVTVGGRYAREAPPTTLRGTLKSAGDNLEVKLKGPANGGEKINIGPYAVVRTGDVYVALTQLPLTWLDPNFYFAMAIPADRLDVLVARSGYHFTLNFAELGDCVTADTPGMTAYRPASQPFTVARPFYPVDAIPYTPVRTLRSGTEPGRVA